MWLAGSGCRDGKWDGKSMQKWCAAVGAHGDAGRARGSNLLALRGQQTGLGCLGEGIMTNGMLKYALPAAVIAGVAGFFVGSTTARGARLHHQAPTLRQAFLSSDDDVVDYTKLARVCLAASARHSGSRTDVQPSILAQATDPKVVESKQSLDQVMGIALERGVWSRGAGVRAQMLLRRLPEADVADFENLLRTTMQRGDLQVGEGAWVPQSVN